MTDFANRQCDCGGVMTHSPPTAQLIKWLLDSGFTNCYEYLPHRHFKCDTCKIKIKLILTDEERKLERIRLGQQDYGLPFTL